MSYLLVKWIHIVSATILFGAGIGSAFHMFVANRRGDVQGIYAAVRTVVLTDWLFTTPAVVVQLVTGVMLVTMLGAPFSAFWIFWGLALYFFAGACWLPVVWMQIKMREMAKAAANAGTALPARYWRYERLWIGLGALAFPALLVVFYLMVFKPT